MVIHSFNVGDTITAKPGESGSVENFMGVPAGTTFTVLSLHGSSIEIKAIGPDMPKASDYMRANRFESAPVRVEGAEILPRDIREGDEILVTRESFGVKHMRQGVVGRITLATDHKHYGKRLFATSTTDTAQRLNWGQEHTETFTLIKAVPERDKLLDRLTGALGGQVIVFREAIARKQYAEKWDVSVAGSTRVEKASTVLLRTSIGDSPVTWLKPEA